MSKEQLEEIKSVSEFQIDNDSHYGRPANVILNRDDVKWLIKQAERAQELEGANTRLLEAFDTKTRVHESLLKDYAALKERVQELEQKLKYAETDLALEERLLKNEKRHKLTYRKVAQRYQGEKNRYREALGNIANIDGYFIDKPFDMAKALELIDREARKALEESE